MTLVLGFTGKQLVGKSTLGGYMREMYGVTDPAADIEFSDPIIDVVNAAIGCQLASDDYEHFRRSLTRLTAELLQLPRAKRPREEPEVCTCWKMDGKPCVECALYEWWLNTLRRRTGAMAGSLAIPTLRLTRENKAEHRSALIWQGTEERLIYGANVWADAACAQAERAAATGVPLISLGGVRMPGDEEAVRALGRKPGITVKLIRVIRPLGEDTDATAASVDGIVCDSTVYNTSDLPELRSMATRIEDDLHYNYLAAAYEPRPGAPITNPLPADD